MVGTDWDFSEMQRFSSGYRQWLKDKVGAERHGILFDILYDTEYTWLVPMDENRAKDGCDLRGVYASTYNLPFDMDWLGYPCSVLEMLIALARHIEDDIMYDPRYGNRTRKWFWEMMGNMGLIGFTDEFLISSGSNGDRMVTSTIASFLNRTWDVDGCGNPFPMDAYFPGPYTELWAMANAYFMQRWG